MPTVGERDIFPVSNPVGHDHPRSLVEKEKVLSALEENGLGTFGLMKSPVRGGDGNTEFLAAARPGEKRLVGERQIREAIDE